MKTLVPNVPLPNSTPPGAMCMMSVILKTTDLNIKPLGDGRVWGGAEDCCF
jgi:hypothetical protein